MMLIAASAVMTNACVVEELRGREFLGGRELACTRTPEALCLRIADIGVGRLDLEQTEREVGPIRTIQVYPEPCTRDMGVDATACWMVEATNEHGGTGVDVIRSGDGSFR